MNKGLLPILSLLVCFLLEANPEIEDASVTLPYHELAALVDRVNSLERANEEKPSKPPVLAIVHTARYRITWENPERSVLHTEFEISNLSDEWKWVPLIQATQAIRSIEPATAVVAESNGRLRLLMEPGAKTSVKLSLMTEQGIRSRGGRTVAAFEAIPAARSSLVIQKESSQSRITVSGAVAANADNTEFGLPSSGGIVRVKRYENSTMASARWNGSAQYLVSEAQGALRTQCRLHLTAMDNGNTSEAELRLPVLANLVHAKSVGLAGQYTTEMTDIGQVIHLRWEDEESTTRLIELEYVVPVESGADVWQVDGVAVSNASRWTQSYYLKEFDGVELSPTVGDWMEAGKAPDWIAAIVGNADLKYTRQKSDSGLQIRARILPRMQTSDATVTLAHYATQLVVEGSMLHQATITVAHDALAPYRFSLPEGAKLLACTVSDRKAEPLLQSDGGLVLNLPKPSNGDSNTKLSYTYTTHGDKLNPVEGKADLVLPLTTLFIHRLNWLVSIPPEYQATALEGNVTIEEGGGENRPIRLAKQLCHGESPYASLYYTRRDLDR